MQLLSMVLLQKLQSPTGKKEVKEIFQAKKGFIACSKLMINELRRSRARSENAYFANNKQASTAVFTTVTSLYFCFAHNEHNLVKIKLYNN